MELEFYTPAEAAELMKCTENFLRDQAYEGKIPHITWGRNKLVFTSEHIREIAELRTRPVRTAAPASQAEQISASSSASVRQIGTRAKKRA
ncbi:helix-turn-helix domain-containing protein [Arthrobacter sp. Soc17.1.1.1]|uniref:helix-turn-helix domain-containing protein n=1 Tax=Arthrobacter sp. Soc17.1.1.1 TaxID=3121277 RepID=UPI002FE4DA68